MKFLYWHCINCDKSEDYKGKVIWKDGKCYLCRQNTLELSEIEIDIQK